MTSTPPQDGQPCPDCPPECCENLAVPCPRLADEPTQDDGPFLGPTTGEIRIAQVIERNRLAQRLAFIAAVDALRIEEDVRQIFRDIDPTA